MTGPGRAVVVSLVFGAMVQWAAARPDFLTLFQQDPLRKPDVDGCATCHVNPRGGGPRNEFGRDFAEAEMKITPMLRASYPDRFTVPTNEVAGVGKFYYSDPEGKIVVYEKEGEKYAIDLAEVMQGAAAPSAGGTPGPDAPEAPAEDAVPRHKVPHFSFFITSVGLGNGGNLGGLAGADRHCQELAAAVGAGHKTWRAYLSTSFDGRPAVNAGDRIGSGPWFNAKGVMVAQGVADLHGPNSRLNAERALNEKGEPVHGVGSDPNQHDILTGTLPNGTAAVDMNCNNWTSDSEGQALVGHFDRQGGGDNAASWNSAHASRSCSQPDLQATGGAGLFYCFAVDPND